MRRRDLLIFEKENTPKHIEVSHIDCKKVLTYFEHTNICVNEP